jgi:hypothetical protein
MDSFSRVLINKLFNYFLLLQEKAGNGAETVAKSSIKLHNLSVVITCPSANSLL